MVCLNLVKAAEKRPRETLLRAEFHSAVSYLNQGVRTLGKQAPTLGSLCEGGEGGGGGAGAKQTLKFACIRMIQALLPCLKMGGHALGFLSCSRTLNTYHPVTVVLVSTVALVEP